MEIAYNDLLHVLNMHLHIFGLDIEIHVSRQIFAHYSFNTYYIRVHV